MNLSVACPCGQTFQVDVEPVNERMPFPVACPACGADCTGLANQAIHAALYPQPVFLSALPHGTALPPSASTPQEPVAAPRLRIERPAPTSAATPAPAPAPPRRLAVPASTSRDDDVEEGNFQLGIIGALLGGVVGVGLWYLLARVTGGELGMMATFVGVLTGLAARYFGREAFPLLGWISALCAVLAITAGEFLVINTKYSRVVQIIPTVAEAAYDEALQIASNAVAAKTDDQIALWLAVNEQMYDPKPTNYADFRTNTLPTMRDLVNGTPSRGEFIRQYLEKLGAQPATPISIEHSAFSSRVDVLISHLGFFSIIWLSLGLAAAYRIPAGGGNG